MKPPELKETTPDSVEIRRGDRLYPLDLCGLVAGYPNPAFYETKPNANYV